MKSAWIELRRYRSTRFPMRIFGTLGVVLCVCAGIPAAVSTGFDLARWPELAARLVPALLLLFGLRLWDDLCDLDRDRLKHPDRVLCTAASLRPFAAAAALAVMVGTASLALLPEPAFAQAVVGGLGLGLALWYGLGRRLLRHRLVNAAVVLLKYPALVLALSGPAAAGILLAVLAPIYLAFGVHEVVHDPATLTECT